MTSSIHPAIAAIEFALTQGPECRAFLESWLHGDFPEIRRDWPEAPDAVFVGADPMHPGTRISPDLETNSATTGAHAQSIDLNAASCSLRLNAAQIAAALEFVAERMRHEPVACVASNGNYSDGSPIPGQKLCWFGRNEVNDLPLGALLYAAPQPTPEDVRDARRYRIIKDMADRQLVGFMDKSQPHTSTDAMFYMPTAAEMDDAADAAMQQEQAK